MNKILLIALLFSAPSVNAAVIVDTGPGPATLNGTSVNYENTPFGIRWQSLAGQFQIGSPFTLTDVEGWISSNSSSHDATVAIYSDGAGVPDVPLHTTTFHAAPGEAWQGATGLSWNLSAGTYWVVFEVLPAQIGSSLSMPNGDGTDPANPLLKYASINQDSGGWHESFVDYGFRVSAVPLPATLPLMLGALGAAGLLRGRRST